MITVSMDEAVWVWLCELLAEVKNSADIADYCRADTEHALEALHAFEAGV